jgi:hypothetical protein
VPSSSGTLGERLRAARERSFVGRAAELAVFREALGGGPDAPAVLHVHGPGGIGKSALLLRFADEAAAAGRDVVRVDGSTLAPPEPATFEAGAAAALTGDRPVLLVDAFEHCQGLESWLVRHFLPRLPASALVVIAGRRPPDPRWRSGPDWSGLLRVLPLTALDRADAAALLTTRSIGPELRDAVLSRTGGHPLALCLAADAVAREGGWEPSSPDLTGALLASLVGDVPSAAHRHALHVCAHARTTTEDLLRAALPDEDSGALFEWLRTRSFVESARHGLRPHDVVRDALDADLRWRDPQGYEVVHHRVRVHLVERALATTGDALLPAVDALKHLHRFGTVTPLYYTFAGDGSVFEDAYRPEDRPELLRMTRETEGERSAELVAHWLDHQPEGFHVHRGSATGLATAFTAWFRIGAEHAELAAADPVVAAAWEHCRSVAPLRRGEHLGVTRFAVDPTAYQRPSAVMDLVLQRSVAEYLRQERLAWTFSVWVDAEFWQPLMTYADHPLVADGVRAGDRTWSLFAHDWRVVPLSTWLEVVGTEDVLGRAPVARPVPLPVLTRPELADAVRDALRSWRSPDLLSANPLIRSALVAGHAADPVAALRQLLTDAVDELRHDPRRVKLHRALTTTHFHGAPTQEEAATRLGLPFSTYRRHLRAGLDHVVDRLWERLIG